MSLVPGGEMGERAAWVTCTLMVTGVPSVALPVKLVVPTTAKVGSGCAAAPSLAAPTSTKRAATTPATHTLIGQVSTHRARLLRAEGHKTRARAWSQLSAVRPRSRPEMPA